MKKMYNSLGFVEALVAIIVSGIASTVLMSIAASTMSNLLKTETMDSMSRHAQSGAIILQQIANLQKNNPENIVGKPLKEMTTACYYLDCNEDGQCQVDEDELVSVDAERTLITDRAKILGSEDYFRYFCVESKGEEIIGEESNVKSLVIKFIVGDVRSKGEITSDSDNKDIEYFSIIRL